MSALFIVRTLRRGFWMGATRAIGELVSLSGDELESYIERLRALRAERDTLDRRVFKRRKQELALDLLQDALDSDSIAAVDETTLIGDESDDPSDDSDASE
tara:strand:- start:318 stop:620 length:303 start_codon:yes stop_codon:yes gene_type:complete